MPITTNPRPILCALNLRHHWTPETTEDGGRFLVCSRCRKEYPGDSRANWPMTGG